jgi:hypothetical protein
MPKSASFSTLHSQNKQHFKLRFEIFLYSPSIHFRTGRIWPGKGDIDPWVKKEFLRLRVSQRSTYRCCLRVRIADIEFLQWTDAPQAIFKRHIELQLTRYNDPAPLFRIRLAGVGSTCLVLR